MQVVKCTTKEFTCLGKTVGEMTLVVRLENRDRGIEAFSHRLGSHRSLFLI